jgi:alpha-glucosidase
MAGMTIGQMLNAMSGRMAVLGGLYPLRRALRVAQNEHPGQRGPAIWLAALKKLGDPAAPPRPPLDTFRAVGPLTAIERDGRGVTLRGEGGALRVEALADDLLSIRMRADGDFDEPFSYSVARPPADWPGADLDVRETGSAVEITTGALRLRIDRASGVVGLAGADGAPMFAGALGPARHGASGQIAWAADFGPGAPFYGLGEKATRLDKAGMAFELWNTDPGGYGRGDDPIYLSVPFVQAVVEGQVVGLFFDNTYRTWVDLGAETPGRLTYRAAGGEFRLYVMVGTPAAVMARYTGLTGRMPLPPLWALGFHQSRWSYYPQARVLEVARGFRERRLPCDVIHLDIHYMDDYRIFTWDRERFPQPRKMLDTLHEQGFKALSMIDPGVKVDPGYFVYDEGVARDAFVKYPDGRRFTGPVWPGNCHFPDFSDPAVRQWWGGLYGSLLDDGVDAFWNDMNEPAIIAHNPEAREVPAILRHSKEGQGATHAEIHNVYGLLMVRASVEGVRRLRPDRRALLLTRSGWAGVQRYALHWTGDNTSTWDHLRLSISMVLNLGLSGIAFTGPDVGGFTGGPPPELYARWMQLGAFTPFYRAHSMIGSPDQEPWAFGPEVEAVARKALELRYRLLPYIYTAVWQSTQNGVPIMRPAWYDDPGNAALHAVDDQFFFGDALFVAPIVEQGAVRRRVTLPAGAWFDFWSGERHEGGQVAEVDAPLDAIPLFVRGGAVIPLWPVQQYVGEKAVDALEARVFWSEGEYESALYEDDGVTPDTASPAGHRTSQFVVEAHGDRAGRVIRRIDEGDYTPTYGLTRLHIAGLAGPPERVEAVEGTIRTSAWDDESGVLTVEVDGAGAFDLRLD